MCFFVSDPLGFFNGTMEKIKPQAEIEDEIELHEKGWIIQRVGWVILFTVLTAAILGLFGSGVLSDEYLTGPEGTIQFERFARFETPMELRIDGRDRNSFLEITFPLTYFSEMELERIQPAPTAQAFENDNIVYRFAVREVTQVKFYFVPKSTGKITTQLQINKEPYSIHHFIYP
jgi:hypothetical protein